MVFQKILVALDRSSQSSIVFSHALEQTRQPGSELLLVHVVRSDPEVPAGSFMGLGTIADVDTYGALKKLQQERLHKELHQAEQWLVPYQQQAIDQQVSTTIDCRVGEPSLWICELARNWGADLIVLGRRGHQGIREVVLGSVSNYVIHHASCSVLVVQGIVEGDL